MRKIFFLAAATLVLSFSIKAQNVGINSDGSQPDPSAILDVKSSNKGILIPRVALTNAKDMASVASPKNALMIYNTSSAGSGMDAVEPGFYFWKDTSWVKLIHNGNNLSSPWSLGGNKGTSPATHFIGTTDSTSLQLKVNNKASGKIDINNVNTFFGYRAGENFTTGYGSIGIGQKALQNNTTGRDNIAIGEAALGSVVSLYDNVAIGKFSLAADTSGGYNVAVGNFTLQSNSSGGENTAIGRAAMLTNTIGNGNTALGYQSLAFNSTASSNTGLGRTALMNNTTGNENTAAGRSALFNNSAGSQNTAVGRNALQTNTTGNLNAALGFSADVVGNNLNNATAIGAQATVACSNCMVLGSVTGVNGATSDVNIGIGTNLPVQPLSFKNALGGKISFWNGGVGHYGFGVQSGLFQMYSDVQGSDIAFGWGKSDAFTETMRVKGSGQVGIGTNAPAHSLDIRSASDLNKTQLRLHQTNTDFARIRFTNVTAANYWDVAARPEAASSNAFFNIYYSPAGQNILSLRGDGNATLLGTLTQNSDARLKKNIRKMEQPLEKLLQLNGYTYNWTDENRDASLQTGVIAQEVQQLFPQLVKEDEKGILSVNYSGLIPVLIEAIKEQQKQIDELKKLTRYNR